MQALPRTPLYWVWVATTSLLAGSIARTYQLQGSFGRSLGLVWHLGCNQTKPKHSPRNDWQLSDAPSNMPTDSVSQPKYCLSCMPKLVTLTRAYVWCASTTGPLALQISSPSLKIIPKKLKISSLSSLTWQPSAKVFIDFHYTSLIIVVWPKWPLKGFPQDSNQVVELYS